MLHKWTNIKLKETKKYLVEDTGKKATKDWLLDSEEKCLIQTAFRRTAYNGLTTQKNTIRKTLILYEKG